MVDPALLDRARGHAVRFLESLATRPVHRNPTAESMRDQFASPLPERGEDGAQVIDALVEAVEPGLVATAGPRYFGFVIGGSLPAALAADWLASAWDQNAGLFAGSPAGAACEEVVSGWLLDLLDLPRESSIGFVTGCQMANFTGLAAGRHAVLSRAGWDVERDGLQGAPRVRVIVGGDAHATIFTSLRMLGLGAGNAIVVEHDGAGRMKTAALERALAEGTGPTIVCAQAGNVNTGAFDPFESIADACERAGAWLHVDGAFGLWARASSSLKALTRGVERADSWATDAHKWLNVPYDSGLAIVRDASAHRGAMTSSAAYYEMAGGRREPHEYVPEASRRARAFPLYAALRSLGRSGVEAMVDRCCELARRFADGLARVEGVTILNDVVLNQVLVDVEPPAEVELDVFVRAVIDRVQRSGECWLGGTTWRGRAAIRISISNWSTTEGDVERSLAAISDSVAQARGAGVG
jgi:glutamate/tyrosine decarboxylase-like PLP-dependent enzyme